MFTFSRKVFRIRVAWGSCVIVEIAESILANKTFRFFYEQRSCHFSTFPLLHGEDFAGNIAMEFFYREK